MPPYWSLGFHLCRYGYRTLNNTMKTFRRNIEAGIPIDTQWIDIDAMDKGDSFTYDKVNFAGMPEYVNQLHKEGKASEEVFRKIEREIDLEEARLRLGLYRE